MDHGNGRECGRVFKLKKRAARVILDANLRDRSKDLLDGLIGCRLRRK